MLAKSRRDIMARRRRTYSSRPRTRTVTKYVRSRASKSGLKGMTKPLIGGVVTGVIQSAIPNDALMGFGDVAVPIGVGYFMNDKTLMTLGAYQAGLKLSSNINLGGIATSSSGGGY